MTEASARRVEKLHNLIVDAITSSGRRERKRPFTMHEVIAALELVKTEVIYQHLLKEYSIKIDTSSSLPLEPEKTAFDGKGSK